MKESSLGDRNVKNCNEQISYWENGDRLASKGNALGS